MEKLRLVLKKLLMNLIIFSNIGPLTEKSIPINPKGNHKSFLKDRNQLDFLLTFVSNEEIFEIIQSLESKSIGPNSVPIRLLKLIPDLIIVQNY